MKPSEFREKRDIQNKLVLDKANLQIRRFFNLDTQAYTDGALDAKTKEMLGGFIGLALR